MAENCGKHWMGEGTHEIPMQLFELNRKRLSENLLTKDVPSNAIVFLQGGSDIPFNDTDVNILFRQESYFMWTFGVLEPHCFGAVKIDSGEAYLFVPRLPESDAIWMGPIQSLEEFSKKYMISNVHYTDEISQVLINLNVNTLLVLNGINSDSGLRPQKLIFEGIQNFTLEKKILYSSMAGLRVIKTDLEIDVMRYVVETSSAAHRKVMRMAKPGKSEYQCESEFLHHIYSIGGCRHVSYTCICGSGTNSAVLHYGHAGAPNNRFIKAGELCSFDMGGNYFGYAADITCSFPVDGKFTADQKLIYEAVLDANLAVTNNAKPGVQWTDMHLLANRVILTKLKDGGLLKGDVNEMMENGLGYIFQPHGLGHLLGLDVHDVGGYLPDSPERLEKPAGLYQLRTSRILQEGMVLTIEPGCYFIDPLLDKALEDSVLSNYLVPEVIKRFRGFGGVRIEDDVLITAIGVVNLTKVPRTVQEIEDWLCFKDDDKY